MICGVAKRGGTCGATFGATCGVVCGTEKTRGFGATMRGATCGAEKCGATGAEKWGVTGAVKCGAAGAEKCGTAGAAGAACGAPPPMPPPIPPPKPRCCAAAGVAAMAQTVMADVVKAARRMRALRMARTPMCPPDPIFEIGAVRFPPQGPARAYVQKSY